VAQRESLTPASLNISQGASNRERLKTASRHDGSTVPLLRRTSMKTRRGAGPRWYGCMPRVADTTGVQQRQQSVPVEAVAPHQTMTAPRCSSSLSQGIPVRRCMSSRRAMCCRVCGACFPCAGKLQGRQSRKRLNAGHPVLLSRNCAFHTRKLSNFLMMVLSSSNKEVASKPVGSQPVELSEIN
jgi:hypothetical protein